MTSLSGRAWFFRFSRNSCWPFIRYEMKVGRWRRSILTLSVRPLGLVWVMERLTPSTSKSHFQSPRRRRALWMECNFIKSFCRSHSGGTPSLVLSARLLATIFRGPLRPRRPSKTRRSSGTLLQESLLRSASLSMRRSGLPRVQRKLRTFSGQGEEDGEGSMNSIKRPTDQTRLTGSCSSA